MKRLAAWLILSFISISTFAALDLRQSTGTHVILGPFVSTNVVDSGSNTIDVTAVNCQIMKNSVVSALTLTADAGVNDCSHVGDGYYRLELAVANTDTLGRCKVTMSASNALLVWQDIQVINTNLFDSKYSTDNQQVDVIAVADAPVSGVGVFRATEVTATSVTDKTGYTAATVSDKTGYSISGSITTLDGLNNFDPSSDQVDVNQINNSAVTGPNDLKADVSGLSTVTIAQYRAAAEEVVSEGTVAVKADIAALNNFDNTSDQVIVATNNDKTGYTASTVSDKTGYSISGVITTLDGLNDLSTADVSGVIATDITAVSTEYGSAAGGATQSQVRTIAEEVVSEATGYLPAANADANWDEVITGFHNETNSAATIIQDGSATGAGAFTLADIRAVAEEVISEGTGDVKADIAALNNFDNTSDQVIVVTNNDKTGYTASTVSDKTGYSISGAITTLDGLNNFDPSSDQVDVNQINNSAVTGPNDLKADVSGLSTVSITQYRAVAEEIVTEATIDIKTDISGLNDLSSANVSSLIASDIIAVSDEFGSGGGGSGATYNEVNQIVTNRVNDATTTEAGRIWDALIASYQDAGSTGETLFGAGGGSSPTQIANAVLASDITQNATPGTLGGSILSVTPYILDASISIEAEIGDLNDLSFAQLNSEIEQATEVVISASVSIEDEISTIDSSVSDLLELLQAR